MDRICVGICAHIMHMHYAVGRIPPTAFWNIRKNEKGIQRKYIKTIAFRSSCGKITKVLDTKTDLSSSLSDSTSESSASIFLGIILSSTSLFVPIFYCKPIGRTLKQQNDFTCESRKYKKVCQNGRQFMTKQITFQEKLACA